jgi:hypothetical protein
MEKESDFEILKYEENYGKVNAKDLEYLLPPTVNTYIDFRINKIEFHENKVHLVWVFKIEFLPLDTLAMYDFYYSADIILIDRKLAIKSNVYSNDSTNALSDILKESGKKCLLSLEKRYMEQFNQGLQGSKSISKDESYKILLDALNIYTKKN